MINDMLNIIANDYRRCTLLALLERSRRNETGVWLPDDMAIGPSEYDKRVIELRHCHLPMLADSELIEWDRETQEIMHGPRFDDVRPLLEVLIDHRDELPDEWLVTPPLE